MSEREGAEAGGEERRERAREETGGGGNAGRSRLTPGTEGPAPKGEEVGRGRRGEIVRGAARRGAWAGEGAG